MKANARSKGRKQHLDAGAREREALRRLPGEEGRLQRLIYGSSEAEFDLAIADEAAKEALAGRRVEFVPGRRD